MVIVKHEDDLTRAEREREREREPAVLDNTARRNCAARATNSVGIIQKWTPLRAARVRRNCADRRRYRGKLNVKLMER